MKAKKGKTMRGFIVAVSAFALASCQGAETTSSEASVPSLEDCRAQGAQNTQNCRAVVRAWQEGFETAFSEISQSESFEVFRRNNFGSPYMDVTYPGFDEFVARCVGNGTISLHHNLLGLYRAFVLATESERADCSADKFAILSRGNSATLQTLSRGNQSTEGEAGP